MYNKAYRKFRRELPIEGRLKSRILRSDSQVREAKGKMMKVNIPKRITNETTLDILRGLRRAGSLVPPPVSSRIIKDHLEDNIKAFNAHRKKITEDGGYIENQNDYSDMYYGTRTVRFSGCEIIASYNVLHALTGREPSFSKMIAAFEKNGMIFYGNLGTDPGKMRSFLKKQGFKVEEFTDINAYRKSREGERPVRKGKEEAFVLTLYNDRTDLMKGIHTVAVTKKERWYFLHNDGGTRARGPFAGIEQVLDHYERIGARMISVLRVTKI